MRAAMLVVSVVVMYALSATDASRCDDTIVHNIQHSWVVATGVVPSHVLQGIKAAGRSANVRVSADIGSTMKCMFVLLEQPEGKKGMDLHFINVLKSGEEKTGSIYVEESDDGHLENQKASGAGKANRYLIYHKPGVWAFYKCEVEGAPGEPQGYVKVAVSGAAGAAAQVEEAMTALGKYGIKATRKLSTDCKVSGRKGKKN